MRRALLIIPFLFMIVPVRAQWDTASATVSYIGRDRCNTQWVSPTVGTTLMAGGALFTFAPGPHGVSVQLRDNLQADNHNRLSFDNYIQYLPVATTVALNLCGVKGRHDIKKTVLLGGGSYLLGFVLLEAGKYGFGVHRPDGTSYNSFPSGHTFTAFTGAELLRREYGEDYPWIAVAGYAVAATVGFMRMYNNRHWLGDVAAGAGLGILSVDLVYWLFDKD